MSIDVAKTVENLTKNGFNAVYFDTRDEAVEYILSLVPSDATIGFGGSKTVSDLKLAEKFFERCNVLMHAKYVFDTPQEKLYRAALEQEWFVSSANALTEEGEIVNTDGRANRVAGLIFGPKNILTVVGANKIVPDLNAAFRRIRTVSAPLNMKRFNRTAPCLDDGNCGDCPLDKCICNVTTIHHHPTFEKVFHVVIIGEDMGF